jgi:tetratricopeptide (TPR) repeat protein
MAMRAWIALTLIGLGSVGIGQAFSFLQGDEKVKEKGEKPQRFDLEVREDLFAGFAGDEEALKRGLAKCEEAIKKEPKHAEALVWRGAARVYMAGKLFGAKKQAEALPIWVSGLADMDEAVKLEPKNAGVRIPRASVLVPAARNTPPAIGKPLLEKAMEDFQTIYELQKNDLDRLGTHPRGELRMGLADVYRLMGKADQSREQLEAVVKELPDTKYASRAKEWLAAKPQAKLAHNCIGCHRK